MSLYNLLITGSGEDRRLHEIKPIHEDSCKQQDGQMGTQERVKNNVFTQNLVLPPAAPW